MASIATEAEVLEQALSLPAEARAAIAGSLLESLDGSAPDGDVDELWRAEIRKRISELDSGSVATVPWADVRARLAAVLVK